MSYCIYLRKSRADLEAEAHGEGDTLARHEAALLDLAKRRNLPITQIYREVVSGETISARPVVQQLLREVEQGLWDGVLVMEVERLARGDTIDQGVISRAFCFSGTLIVTPIKTFDPNNEFDQEYFEFGLFMSRREYKTINRRLQAGRVASVKEGKFVGSIAPFGYDKKKLPREKGFTLVPNEDADTVRLIFSLRTSEPPLGCSVIARRLNDSACRSATGALWSTAMVRNVVGNPIYCGLLRWNYRPTKKAVSDGSVTCSRPLHSDTLFCKGVHEPIVSEDTFYRAQVAASPANPGNFSAAPKNPLSGLVICADCGHMMVRRPFAGHTASLMCKMTYCHNVSSPIDVVENKILDALRALLSDIEVRPDGRASGSSEVESLAASLRSAESELARIAAQLQRAFDLVEQGVYTTEVFLQRSAALEQRRTELTASRDDLCTRLDHARDVERRRSELAPQIRHVLDCYDSADVIGKHDLLSSVLEKVYYKKTVNLSFRDAVDDTTISIVPKVPFPSHH